MHTRAHTHTHLRIHSVTQAKNKVRWFQAPDVDTYKCVGAMRVHGVGAMRVHGVRAISITTRYSNDISRPQTRRSAAQRRCGGGGARHHSKIRVLEIPGPAGGGWGHPAIITHSQTLRQSASRTCTAWDMTAHVVVVSRQCAM